MKTFRTISLIPVLAVMLLAFGCNTSVSTGVMKTANGGVDWQYANQLSGETPGSISGLNISKLEYSPTDSSVFYAGAYNFGLYKSSDGAENWEQVLSQIPVYDFVLHPYDPNVIFASGLYDGRGRVLTTKDGGKSWNEIFSDANSAYAIRSIALNPNNPLEIIIGSDLGTLVKSSDGGASWKLVQTYNDRISKLYWRTDGVYAVVRSSGIYKSFDSGETFQIITNSLENPSEYSNLAWYGNSVGSYYQMAFSSFNTSVMFMTTDRGVYKTDNGGSSWLFVNLPFTEDTIQPTAIALAPVSDNVLYVSAGSIIYKTVDSGNSWTVSDSKSGSVVSSLLVNSELPQVAYAGLSNTN